MYINSKFWQARVRVVNDYEEAEWLALGNSRVVNDYDNTATV